MQIAILLVEHRFTVLDSIMATDRLCPVRSKYCDKADTKGLWVARAVPSVGPYTRFLVSLIDSLSIRTSC